jgi:hypothetical protein
MVEWKDVKLISSLNKAPDSSKYGGRIRRKVGGTSSLYLVNAPKNPSFSQERMFSLVSPSIRLRSDPWQGRAYGLSELSAHAALSLGTRQKQRDDLNESLGTRLALREPGHEDGATPPPGPPPYPSVHVYFIDMTRNPCRLSVDSHKALNQTKSIRQART